MKQPSLNMIHEDCESSGNAVESLSAKRMQITLGNAIHIWHAKLDNNSKQYPLFQDWLSVEEKTRAEKLKLAYRQRFILTRGILRSLLSRYTEQTPEKINFSYTEFGKPFFISPINLPIEFNLSHSHNRVAFAFTLGTPLGIDLEYKVQRKYIDKIAYRFFSVHDYEKLKRLTGDKKLNTFFNVWVKNEALLKAIGYHLQSHPLSKYKLYNKQPVLIEKKPQTPCSVFTLTLHPGFAAALAVTGKSKTITIKNYAAIY